MSTVFFHALLRFFFILLSVILWDYYEGLNASQALETLQRRLEILGGTQHSQWAIDCEMLQSTASLCKWYDDIA